MWEKLCYGLRLMGVGLASALLPAPERDRLRRDQGVEPSRWSFAVGMVQLICGTGMFLVGGLAFAAGQSTALSLGLLELYQPGLSTTHFQGAGLVGWLTWFLHPAAWLYGAIAVVGLVRVVAFVAAREAVAEPIVLVSLRLAQRWGERRYVRRREQTLGPVRRDRILPGSDERELIVLSCRDKPDWREEVTIEIEGRFYRLTDVEERVEGEWASVAYVLRETDDSTLIRRLIRYDPPPIVAPSGGEPH
jgi:hypothetical protein